MNKRVSINGELVELSVENAIDLYNNIAEIFNLPEEHWMKLHWNGIVDPMTRAEYEALKNRLN